MSHATRVGPDPVPQLDAFRDRTHRVLRGPGSSADVRQAIAEGEQLLEGERADLARLKTEATSRKIRLGNETVRQRHEEHCRASERRVSMLEDLVTELRREIPRREEAERSYDALEAATNPVTKRLNFNFPRKYQRLAGDLAALLLELREQAARIEEVRQLGRAIGRGNGLFSLTQPVAVGTPELLPVWVDGLVRLSSLWNENLTFWPTVPGMTAAQLLDAPPVRQPQRNPAAVQAQAEREAHLDLSQPFTHHGTHEDDNRQRERQAAALEQRQRRTGVLDPGVKSEDSKAGA